jgi:LacI family transcriptional regulator, repressor for deo operon, udp, cdd, tsx, nupC, and nupG
MEYSEQGRQGCHGELVTGSATADDPAATVRHATDPMKALTLACLPMSDPTNPLAPPPGRTRIEDVAAAANVSVATVSRALRNLPNVAESTRAHVVAVAEQLNYRADPAASRLAAGRGSTITVLVPHLTSWYFSTVIAGAEAVCSEAGYECLVIGVGSIAGCNRLIDEPGHLERRTDGVVLVNVPASVTQAESLRERGVALATVGTRTPGHPSVSIDDVRTGRIAVEHLVSLGHERIGLISGQSNDPMNFAVPQQRRTGFVDALSDAGLEFDPTLVESGNFGIDGGQEAMVTLLDHPRPPTAVFAMSDEMAFGALMELDRRSLRPGKDVSVIGVDDHDVSRVLGLTTIRQRVAGQGAAAARALLARIADRNAPAVDVDSPLELVVRTTTGPRT